MNDSTVDVRKVQVHKIKDRHISFLEEQIKLRDEVITEARNVIEKNHLRCEFDDSRLEGLDEIKVKAGFGLPSISIAGSGLNGGSASLNTSIVHNTKAGGHNTSIPKSSNREEKAAAAHRQRNQNHESLPPIRRNFMGQKASDAGSYGSNGKVPLRAQKQQFLDLPSGKLQCIKNVSSDSSIERSGKGEKHFVNRKYGSLANRDSYHGHGHNHSHVASSYLNTSKSPSMAHLRNQPQKNARKPYLVRPEN